MIQYLYNTRLRFKTYSGKDYVEIASLKNRLRLYSDDVMRLTKRGFQKSLLRGNNGRWYLNVDSALSWLYFAKKHWSNLTTVELYDHLISCFKGSSSDPAVELSDSQVVDYPSTFVSDIKLLHSSIFNLPELEKLKEMKSKLDAEKLAYATAVANRVREEVLKSLDIRLSTC